MNRPKYLWEKIYELIISIPEGLNIEEIKKRFNTTTSSVYSQINLINNKKDTEYKIKNIAGIYLAFKKGNEIVLNKPKKPINNTVNFIPKHLFSIISDLSETDRKDFNDMLKKSIFYGKSAIALLEANDHVKHLTKGV